MCHLSFQLTMKEKQYDALKEERDILKEDLNSTHLSKEELIKKVSSATAVLICHFRSNNYIETIVFLHCYSEFANKQRRDLHCHLLTYIDLHWPLLTSACPQAWEVRDKAVARKNATEIDLARARIDVMQINSQLLESIQQKVELSCQLDQWQVGAGAA